MQVNVLGAERRRRWSYDEKVRLVEETLQPGETVCGARRHGVAHSLLFTWRRQARQGRLGGDAAPALVPVEITPVAAPISSSAPQPTSSPPAQRARAEIIEIELERRLSCSLTVTWMLRRCSRFLALATTMIPIPSGVSVWIATGHTDMRRGMRSLAVTVQESLKRDHHLCVGRDYVAKAPERQPGPATAGFLRHIIFRASGADAESSPCAVTSEGQLR